MFSAKLIKRITRSNTVESFRFLADKKVSFLSGQFTQVILDKDNINNKNLNKYLSFSSSPNKDYFEVTKKLTSSEFSKKLKDLKINDKVYFKEPMGNCTCSVDCKKIGFLVGGIGITPVISIVEYIMDEKIDTDIILLYSSRTEDIAFKKELDFWENSSSNFKATYIVTECQPKDFRCVSGSIDKDLLLSKIEDLCDRTFFIFGPPSMVSAMKRLCQNVGCQDQKIKAESFIGY